MNRIDRLNAILIQLQTKKVLTAQEIADRFEISVRTVYRDIRALEASGVPIGAEAGKGYFITDGYFLPPVTFTEDEAAAFLLGGKLVEAHSDESIKNNFRDAMMKVRSVLKSHQKDQIESLDQQMKVLHPVAKPLSDFPNHYLTAIQNAISKKKVLRLEYYANYNDQTTVRDVEASGLCFYGGHWHLIAWCRLRSDFRDFRSDRISKLSIIDEDVLIDRVIDFENFVATIASSNALIPIRLKINKGKVRYLGDQKYYYGYVKMEESGEDFLIDFMFYNLNLFARWIVSYSNSLEVLSPPALIEEIYSIIEELQEHYKKV